MEKLFLAHWDLVGFTMYPKEHPGGIKVVRWQDCRMAELEDRSGRSLKLSWSIVFRALFQQAKFIEEDFNRVEHIVWRLLKEASTWFAKLKRSYSNADESGRMRIRRHFEMSQADYHSQYKSERMAALERTYASRVFNDSIDSLLAWEPFVFRSASHCQTFFRERFQFTISSGLLKRCCSERRLKNKDDGFETKTAELESTHPLQGISGSLQKWHDCLLDQAEKLKFARYNPAQNKHEWIDSKRVIITTETTLEYNKGTEEFRAVVGHDMNGDSTCPIWWFSPGREGDADLKEFAQLINNELPDKKHQLCCNIPTIAGRDENRADALLRGILHNFPDVANEDGKRVLWIADSDQDLNGDFAKRLHKLGIILFLWLPYDHSSLESPIVKLLNGWVSSETVSPLEAKSALLHLGRRIIQSSRKTAILSEMKSTAWYMFFKPSTVSFRMWLKSTSTVAKKRKYSSVNQFVTD